jgi:xanthine dehydrogenase accessory factor
MDVDLFEELVRMRREGTPCALATVVRTAGSTPQKAAARMLVGPTGVVRGTIGGGRVEKEVTDAALALLSEGQAARPRLLRFQLTKELAMCCGGEMEVFVEPMVPPPPLVVVGGGHVARALVPLAERVGFQVWVADDLDENLTRDRFPDAAGFLDSFDPADWARSVPVDSRTYVVIVTRDHAEDQRVLERLWTRELAYVGLIGSRRKIAMFRARLEAKGIDPGGWARVHAPIGLDIGAESPEEIAVAIVAELIQTRASRRPKRTPQT